MAERLFSRYDERMATDAPRRRRRFGVTQEDVGRAAGVSGKTVARVIAGDPHVSEATRLRVESAIARMGFRANFAARSLAAAKSYLIGIFAPNNTSLYHADLFRGAAAACAARGYHLLLEQYDVERGNSPTERYEASLRKAHCDGVILPPPVSNDDGLIARLMRDGMAYVRIAPADPGATAPAVLAAERTGIEAIVDHLWSLGHRRFGLLTPPDGRPYLRRRNEAFLERVLQRGGSAKDVQTAQFHRDMSGVMGGRAAARDLLMRPDRPSAVFAFNDEFAHGVMICAQEMGLPIPAALSVAGFDDGAAAQFAWPPLTTIRQPLEEMATKAVELLLQGGDTCHCPVELVVRSSTGPAALEC